MNFVLNMARREMRASWHRLLFFFICIALGVGSIVSLRSLVQNARMTMLREARALITADVQLAASGRWNAEAQAVIDKYRQSPLVLGSTETIETATMLRPLNNESSRPKLVELKAVQPGFPFYGEMRLANGQQYSHALLKGQGALCPPSVMIQFNLKVGDQIKLGNLVFTVRGVIESEPGSTLNAFSAGPRVFTDYDDAFAAGLVAFGSRARFKVLFKTREGQAENVQRMIRNELNAQPAVSVRSFRDTENRLSESLMRVENYLSLIGLVILVLGGIGISSVTRVFIQQKMKTIAILKCLGGNNARVLGTYLVQVLILGLSGSALGILLARLTMWALPKYYADRLPQGLEFGLTWQATLQGLLIGLLISLLFSLLPLLEIRRIKPNLVLRNETSAGALNKKWWHIEWRRIDWLRVSTAFIVTLGLVALAGWQAGSLKTGAIFLAGLAVTALILNIVATVLVRSLRQIRHLPSFALRQGINSLYRPGNQTKVILLAVGLGAFFIIAVQLLQANLLNEFNFAFSGNAEDMYLIDIQKDQRDPLATLIAEKTGTKPNLVPVTRMRIVQINSEPISQETVDRPDGERKGPRRERGLLDREYTVTYSRSLENSGALISGKFWEPTPSVQPEISIDEVMAQNLKVGTGDTITFDHLGTRLSARITSVRRVDWRNVRLGFFVIFRAGVLEDAPHNFITAIKGPPPGEARAQLQRDVVNKFPNVSVIDIYDILAIVRKVIGNITTIVTFVGGFIFLSGLLILIGSIAMTKYHRLYESAILKTLGARKKLIITITLIEYAVLGCLAGLIGSAAAVALTWAISRHGLEIPWSFMPSINLIGVAATLVVVMLVGVLSSWDVMVKKPLGILRAE
ncbi:MAG TPA: FtsX-like permease family protein [Blastocatellia bacterium]|nr:FtsX-like permease family protein [Blastocatellia bacterium]